MYKFVFCLLFALTCGALSAQDDSDDVEIYYGTYYGVMGGLGLSNQTWQSNINTNIIVTPSIDVFAETYESGSLSSLYALLGYHQRGSGLGGFGRGNFATYRFHNAVLELGGKRKAFGNDVWGGYYLLGLRGEYTITSNLGSGTSASIINFVDEEYIRRFNYGVTVGGGFQKELENLGVIFFELVFSPDLSAQYDQPFAIAVTNPWDTTRTITLQPQKVRNYSLELKVGYKWLY